ncbi:uncharacterized protein F5Z01DRAFT_645700 [Emericellopsis atlantica]|uniref:Secreted protein n=1 Tax=Emericellopsis atlantica TaxID=2614577 RepID=A0A9P7ZT63_9HYPO|nr:uncharacterized protein F5Z01DRAFT_645700 [Emericellopsis atlantica]KAG9257361.1 hypothetical protein F5Z01DRAFT_645700 [Emericellopsis atlantica]
MAQSQPDHFIELWCYAGILLLLLCMHSQAACACRYVLHGSCLLTGAVGVHQTSELGPVFPLRPQYVATNRCWDILLLVMTKASHMGVFIDSSVSPDSSAMAFWTNKVPL